MDESIKTEDHDVWEDVAERLKDFGKWRMHPSMKVCVYTYIHTYIPTYLHTYIHTYIHTIQYNTMQYNTCICNTIHAYIHCILTYICIYTYTRIHTMFTQHFP